MVELIDCIRNKDNVVTVEQAVSTHDQKISELIGTSCLRMLQRLLDYKDGTHLKLRIDLSIRRSFFWMLW